MARCEWCGDDPLYVKYHDEEWGKPLHDSRALWECLMLEGFQAGLSWITILRKRENFRQAFDGFDPHRVARFDEAKVDALCKNERIIRHKGKIEATIKAAQIFLEIEAQEGFANYIWSFVEGKPIVNSPKSLADIPAQTPASERLSKSLKARGFKFCGPTICYAFMQAVGMVNDHNLTCPAR